MSNDIARISQKVKDAQEFNNVLSQHLKDNLRFNGKSAQEWKKYFKVNIPDEVNPITLVELNKELFRKYQEAAAYRDQQNIQLTILSQSKTDKYNAAFHKARMDHQKEYKKNLSAESCKVVATLAIKDIEDAISNQSIAKDFWKSTCDTLTELRKLLEAMGYALSADARLNNNFNVYENKKRD